MPKPNLLLCFDAFGTLFKPKRPISRQYSEVARQCGISGFSEDELESAFGAAIKDEARRHPNYGKATGLGATAWWTNIIHKTFTPLIKNNGVLPKDLAPKLLHRFSSNEGYDAEPNLASALRALKYQNSRRHFDKIVIGVVTNSDDRVPSILSSLEQDYDIDFHCMSYDVGVEKPDRVIFDAAQLMLTRVIAIRDGKSLTEAKSDMETWQKVYVGDEYAKDVVGALNAGWNPVLLDSDGYSTDTVRVEDHPIQTLEDTFKEHEVLRVHSIQNLATWLTGGK
ncbi:HAD-like domain-containing protein [Dactylonectria estremocensis]|uniref:HAD-like domain-containing protein n=1 Tax=Dactylonectria estremocensis TaxID=1079267 RepID=A0A9P9FLX8_9HYPO|nr:HAD-like domain-containing protein [Dactylonectria estremocensis]